MADQVEQRLVESFCEAWGAVAPALLGRDSAAGLLDLREADGNGLDTALAVAATWSSGFVASCSGALSGAVVCLFKEEDGAEIERLTRQAVDGMPKPGGRSLVRAVLAQAAVDFADRGAPALTLGEVAHLDVSEQGARLARIVGENVWMATLSVTIGDEQETQAMLLYAPQGAVSEPASMMAAQAAASAASLAQRPVARPAAAREQPDARNLDRLLGVELEVVVCFGSTSIPLRDVVRLGTGMMIELNRAVDEPVELMVNGRLLARGEVVVVDGYYGVRITEIGAPGERPLSVILPGGLQ
ncbi:MAG: FliM/FliN family flagellar motor switch protein [Blastocatellia bacterium]|nr:FliM/FliN family flagellar motor switch protein [Blastocatellia bacterium]